MQPKLPQSSLPADTVRPSDIAIRRSALVAATLSSFLTPFMASAVNIALPSIGQELALDAVLLSWVSMAYSLTAAIFLLPFGRIADIHGRRKVFMYGIAAYMITSALCGLATSAAVLISFRLLQGMSGAMIFGTGVAILTSVFPPGERGRVLGLNTATVYAGLSAGPFLGGLLTQQLGWRSIFWVVVPLGAIVIAFTWLKLKGEWAEAKGERFDWPGATVFGLALAALMYGFSRLPAPSGVWLILASIAGMVAFVWWEMRAPSPILHVRLFTRNTVFVFSNLAALINYSATSAVGFLLSLYLQYVQGFSPQQAGAILIAQPIVQAIFSPLSGRLSDTIEPRTVASLGMGLTMVGLFLLAFLGQGTALWLILLNLVLLGFGFALFSSPNTNAIMGAVEKRFYGVASATVGTMRLIGQMLSMGIATLLLSLHVGRAQITVENSASFMQSAQVTFGIFVGLCFLGILASLARGKAHR
jgi:EmrB/QacA subfamily drug resistance transporter